MLSSAALILASAVCGLLPATEVELSGREIRIADIVSLDCIPPSERSGVGELVVAVLPDGRRSRSLARATLADLVRRRAPSLNDLAVEGSGDTMVLRAPPPTARADQRACRAAAHAIEPGEALTVANIIPAPCGAPTSAALRYDRLHGVVRAAQPLPAGARLGPIAAPPNPFPDAEDALLLSVSIGAARIEREVVAAQPSLGEAVFVRDEDGRVFSAPTRSLHLAETAP